MSTIDRVWPIMTRKLTLTEQHWAVYWYVIMFGVLMGMLALLPLH